MNKKLLNIGVVVVLLTAFAACDKLKSLADIKFSVNYSATEEVPGLPNNPFVPPEGLTTSIPTIPVATKSAENISKHNTSSDLIQEVKLGSIGVNIDKPATQNFDIVDSVWLYLSTDRTMSGEILVAKKFGIPKGLKKLDLDVEDVNLKSHFLSDSMYFRLQGHFYNAPDSTTVVTMSTVLNIVANPLKD